MFIICRPEDSNNHLEELIDIEEKLFKSLGLHSKYLHILVSRMFLNVNNEYVSDVAYLIQDS